MSHLQYGSQSNLNKSIMNTDQGLILIILNVVGFSQSQILNPDDPVHVSTHFDQPNPRLRDSEIYPREHPSTRQYYPWGKIPPFGKVATKDVSFVIQIHEIFQPIHDSFFFAGFSAILSLG